MEIIGITGQTGAGKSTVCKALTARGYYHIDAGKIAVSKRRADFNEIAICLR